MSDGSDPYVAPSPLQMQGPLAKILIASWVLLTTVYAYQEGRFFVSRVASLLLLRCPTVSSEISNSVNTTRLFKRKKRGSCCRHFHNILIVCCASCALGNPAGRGGFMIRIPVVPCSYTAHRPPLRSQHTPPKPPGAKHPSVS